MRLAKLHQLSDAKVALLLPQSTKDAKVEGCTEMLLPTWEQGKPGLRKFWVKPLCKELPSLPQQKLAQSRVTVDETPLVVFRATMVQDLCSKHKWEAFKRNPSAQVFATFGQKVTHSTYGWKEAHVTARKGPGDVILQGFVCGLSRQTSEKYLTILVKRGSSLSFWPVILDLNPMCTGYLLLMVKTTKPISLSSVC